jgi:ribokinase
MRSIFVIGSINMDIVNHVQNHPLPGETIKGWGTVYNPGGKGANQAVASARSGGQVIMVGAVGKDSFGCELVKSLKQEGILTDFIIEKEGTTGIAFITVDTSGENSIILSEGSNGKFKPDDLLDLFKMMKSGDILLLQNEIPWETTEYVIKKVQNRGVSVFFNPAPAIKVPNEILSLIDVIILNETEVEAITDIPVTDLQSAKLAAQKLNIIGVKEVVITLGKKGSLYRNQEEMDIFTPSFSVKTIDTTAAGDTFIGAFTVERSKGQSIKECLQYATAAAALSVTVMGAQCSISNQERVLSFLNSFE